MDGAATEGTIAVGERTLAYRTLGAGPPLLVVNGYGATSADWDPVLLGALARSFTLLLPDGRGLGGSDLGDPSAPGDPLTIDGLAEDLLALLDALGFERAATVGWSMGGFVAQRLAARAPERVDALVLLSTDPGGPAAVRAAPEVWARLTDHAGTPRERAARLLALLFPPALAGELDRRFGDVVAQAQAALSPAALAAQEAAIAAWHRDAPAALPDGLPPVLAVHGSEDVVIPAANLDGLAARWPGCRTERFAGGGHAFMAQEPERLAALIAAFAAV